jgi:hypothetical protein
LQKNCRDTAGLARGVGCAPRPIYKLVNEMTANPGRTEEEGPASRSWLTVVRGEFPTAIFLIFNYNVRTSIVQDPMNSRSEDESSRSLTAMSVPKRELGNERIKMIVQGLLYIEGETGPTGS